MPEPEIARRCPSCGASIREQAFFCPLCGKKIEQKSDAPEASALHDTPEIKIHDGDTLTEADFQARQKPPAAPANKPPQPTKRDTQEIIINDGATLTESDFQARQKPPVPPAHKPPETTRRGVKKRTTPAGQKALGEVGARIQRVTTRARDVEGNVIHRVQQFREISSVVIDEAGYDPSLRFVLVAAALFVLFLVIVVLNKLIG